MSISIRTIKDIKKITLSLYKHSATAIAKFIQNHKVNVACHSGCDTCCKTIRIELLPSEAFYIVENIKQNFSAQRISELKDTLKINNAKVINKSLSEYGKEKLDCPFLENNQCSIYNYRPYKCRAYLAIDSEMCKRNACLIPQVPTLDLDEDIKKTLDKYINTLKENKLNTEPAELNNAILMALEDEDLLSKYLNKEQNIFTKLVN